MAILRLGAETTLLILESLDEDETASAGRSDRSRYMESDVMDALVALESDGMVVSKRQQFTPDREKHGGLPELMLGRDNVVWWSLTPEGRSVVD